MFTVLENSSWWPWDEGTYVCPANALRFEWRRWTQGAGSDSQAVDYPSANWQRWRTHQSTP